MRPSEIAGILSRYSVRPSKTRGQNFLLDERVALREVEYASISDEEVVLEVGPGLGVLTELALERAKRVIAIESDAGLCQFLRERFPDLELIEGDALRVGFPPFDRFLSNLPYSISSPLIFKLLDHRFDTGVIMVQKEFGERMVASPGTGSYSRLSVNVYYRAECEILETVPRSRFWPQPEVDSCIVRLVPREAPFYVEDESLFFALVDVLFQHRRKKIGTVLRRRGLVERGRVESLPFIEERVEGLSPEQIGELANAISRMRHH